MQEAPILKAEAPSLDLLRLAAHGVLAKAHVSSYTRKDGVFVAEHDDSRAAARQEAPASKPVAPQPSGGEAAALHESGNHFGGFHGAARRAYFKEKMGRDNDPFSSDTGLFPVGEFGNDRAKAINANKEAQKHAGSQFSEAVNHLVSSGKFKDHDQAANFLDSGKGRGWYENEYKQLKGNQSDAPKPAAPRPAIKTDNEGYGFHGEARAMHERMSRGDRSGGSEKYAADSFSAAANHLLDKGHFKTPEHARDFLDSTYGRHLHDALSFHAKDSSDLSKMPPDKLTEGYVKPYKAAKRMK